MHSLRPVCWLAALGALALTGVPGRVAAEQALIDKGRDIAEQHCIRCHVVRDDSPFSGISSTPSFRLLVTALPNWLERFRTFYERRPHPAVVTFRGFTPLTDDQPPTRTVDLELADVDAIVAFAESLHERYDGKGNAASAGEGPDPLLEGLPGPGPGPGPGAGSAPGQAPGSGQGPATGPAW
jgi:hypothetical protein